ncbi:hypothetical protein PRUPE_2G147800 [Prunus persica]|uniref:Uncharacterized protein n=1 Tax=Prunus persica TaxID=3760 RepID=A0A251QH69_PRUPE|nr:hypothetical protein PRUPE_2G147800 [Prunus persica]
MDGLCFQLPCVFDVHCVHVCVLVSHQREKEREHGREKRNVREWTACETQASSPTNLRRMFQVEVSWVHQRFKGRYISWVRVFFTCMRLEDELNWDFLSSVCTLYGRKFHSFQKVIGFV